MKLLWLQHVHISNERAIAGYVASSWVIWYIIYAMKDFLFDCIVFVPREQVLDITHDTIDVFFHQRIAELDRIPDMSTANQYRLDSYEVFFEDIARLHDQKSMIFEWTPGTDIFECARFISYNQELSAIVVKPYTQKGTWCKIMGIHLDDIETIKLQDDYTMVFDEYFTKKNREEK